MSKFVNSISANHFSFWGTSSPNPLLGLCLGHWEDPPAITPKPPNQTAGAATGEELKNQHKSYNMIKSKCYSSC